MRIGELADATGVTAKTLRPAATLPAPSPTRLDEVEQRLEELHATRDQL